VSAARRAPRQQVRYRVTVAELVGDTATVVMEATGAGFHAAVGDLEGDRLLAEHGVGGDSHLLEHLVGASRRADRRPSNRTSPPDPVTHYGSPCCEAIGGTAVIVVVVGDFEHRQRVWRPTMAERVQVPEITNPDGNRPQAAGWAGRGAAGPCA
jgi:hypothetical protein